MSILTKEQLQSIAKRASAASPGPWAYESVSEKSNDYCVGIVYPVDEDGDPGNPITGNVKNHPHHFNAATGDFGEWCCEMVCSIDEGAHGGDGNPHDDARFIAHARTDIPALLRHIDEMTREIDTLRGAPALTGKLLAHLDIAVIAMNEAAEAMEGECLEHQAKYLRRAADRARGIVTAHQQNIRDEVDRILGRSRPTRKPEAGPVRRSPEGEAG